MNHKPSTKRRRANKPRGALKSEQPKKTDLEHKEHTLSKSKFRESKRWKDFRQVVADYYKHCDPITKQRLRKGFNVHHLNMNVDDYQNIDDPSEFLPLNSATHDAIHFLYHYWKADPTILVRIKKVLVMMDEINSRERDEDGMIPSVSVADYFPSKEETERMKKKRKRKVIKEGRSKVDIDKELDKVEAEDESIDEYFASQVPEEPAYEEMTDKEDDVNDVNDEDGK